LSSLYSHYQDIDNNIISNIIQLLKSSPTKEANICLTFVKQLLKKGIINTPKPSNDLITITSQQTATQLSKQDILTLSEARTQLNTLLTQQHFEQRTINLVKQQLKPNCLYNVDINETLRKEHLNAILPTHGLVQQGEVIIKKGEVIDSNLYRKIYSLDIKYNNGQSLSKEHQLMIWLGYFLLVGLMISLLMIFLYLFRKDIFDDNRLLLVIMLTIISMLFLLSCAVKFQTQSVYFIPYCMVPIIIRILFDTRLALKIHLLVTIIGSLFIQHSFEFVILQTAAGMMAIYSIKTITRREQFFISAMLILLSYIITYIGIHLIRGESLSTLGIMNFTPFVFSVLLTLLAYPTIYLFEKLFGITSDLTLMELTNTNSPLLRELALKAPGTFQHALQVANLAEAAIYKIGGNSLLIRAGALYHDIGKLNNPQYFIENQATNGINPHEKLSYEESAEIIISHVKNGMQLAKQHKLPKAIIDFIQTHHGNGRVGYFYQSFIKNSPKTTIDDTRFRYPGPIPISKETGTLMLADSVEAASRSLKEPTASNINELVDRIVNDKLAQKQLGNCDITLKDIEIIKNIFKSMLMSIYHIRVEYQIT